MAATSTKPKARNGPRVAQPADPSAKPQDGATCANCQGCLYYAVSRSQGSRWVHWDGDGVRCPKAGA